MSEYLRAPPSTGSGGPSANAEQTLDELHQEALAEGGTLVYYGVLAQENAALILPVFEERFPGITIEHIDATGDQLVARAVAEARGGAVQGDVLAVPLENVIEAIQADLLESWLPPEADAYADRVVILHDGHLAADGSPWETLTEGLLSEVFACPILVTKHPARDCPLVLPIPSRA